MNFQQKVILITGAANGIGAATSRRISAEGGTVVLTDVDDVTGQLLAEELSADGRSAQYQHLNVADESNWQNVINTVVEQFGRLDGLVNNAGISDLRTIEESTLEDFNRVIGILQTGVFLGMKSSGDLLKQHGGSVVNVSSMFGTVGGIGPSPAYHAAKGGIRTMSKGAAVNWGAEGVRVNSVHPGFIDTAMIAGAPRETLEDTPLQRPGTADEVASAISFLLSEDASFITGAELAVDGGYVAR